MKYFVIFDKNIAKTFQLQWKIGNVSDMFLQYSVLFGTIYPSHRQRVSLRLSLDNGEGIGGQHTYPTDSEIVITIF